MINPQNFDELSALKSILVSDSKQLQTCVQQLEHFDVIAIDTEFIRTDTFFPILALVQIFNGENCWLIDPISVSDLSPLRELLMNDETLKVFHSCSEDIEVLSCTLRCCPQPIFDTQIAAALTGYGFSIGYASLAKSMLGVHVDKGETRSNWLRRPLSQSQLGYAALDVIYLLPIYFQLKKKLAELGRKKWIDEEMSRLIEEASTKEDLSQYFQKVKGAWKLPSEKLSALQLICEWREQEARDKNKPRGRIIDDKTIVEIVSSATQSKKSLSQIEGMHPYLVERYSEKLLGLIKEGLARPAKEHPAPLTEPLPKHMGSTIKKLKQIVNTKAELLNIAPEILARKKDIEFLVHSIISQENIRLPDKIAKGWRFDVIGSALLISSND
jgi:ribonuclease D